MNKSVNIFLKWSVIGAAITLFSTSSYYGFQWLVTTKFDYHWSAPAINKLHSAVLLIPSIGLLIGTIALAIHYLINDIKKPKP